MARSEPVKTLLTAKRPPTSAVSGSAPEPKLRSGKSSSRSQSFASGTGALSE
jgi:hypothetical protein